MLSLPSHSHLYLNFPPQPIFLVTSYFFSCLSVRGVMTEVTPFWMREALLKQISKEAWDWRYHNIQLQTILQSHSNKNSIILSQKQIWRPVEQNRGLEYESMQLCLLNFWQLPKIYDGEKTASSTNVAGKTGYLHAKNWN
jgi:hypothetical protein